MNAKKLIKAANSKGTLAKAIINYQRALSYYAAEEHWAVRGEDILWVKDDDPTLPAQTCLGMRKSLSGNRTQKGDNNENKI